MKHLRLLLLGFILLNFQQILPAQNPEGNDSIIIFEEGGFGVKRSSKDSTQIIVPPTYDYVELLDSVNLIEVRRYSLTPGDSTKKLPAPVIEFYDFDGDLTLRNINLLVEADESGYYCREYQKRYFSAEMDIALMVRDAANEKINGRRREAYRKYMEIYRKYPNFDYAKNAADNIKESIRDEREATIAQMQQEEAERKAAVEALQASLQQLGNAIGQTSVQKHSPSAQRRTQAHSSSNTQKRTTSNNSSTNQRRTTSANSTTTKKAPYNSKSVYIWCYDKKLVKCTLCNGSGNCTFCHGGKVNGFTCRTCGGSNVCKRCHGAKQIYQ